MDPKTFEYIYYKTRGYSDKEIMTEANISEEEFHLFEQAMDPLIQEIYAERPKAENIGSEFVRLTRYIHDRKVIRNAV